MLFRSSCYFEFQEEIMNSFCVFLLTANEQTDRETKTNIKKITPHFVGGNDSKEGRSPDGVMQL